LASCRPLSQSALSQHLALLRDKGVVATRREGQTIFYRISDPAALRVIATLAEMFCPEGPGQPLGQIPQGDL
jgi:DNA-binding transcriptional ArsR family regulator